MYPKKWFKITAHLLPLTSRSFFIIFNYLYFLYIFIYSNVWFPGWKQFSNRATTIKCSSNYRYWGAGHRAWTRPWQLILMHLDTHPPCNMSSNLSWRLPEYVFYLAFSFHQEDLQCNLAPTRVCHLLVAICQRKPILMRGLFVKINLIQTLARVNNQI